ncbi:MAG: amino acid permease [Clostridiales bacterium]|jgi:APA family basic amino acid/polyamine antiporter|nr:amino acid permease [Clostridiales bacterium]
MQSDSSHNALTRKYGLIAAIAMVVGSVIGAGIFFRPGRVLFNTDGDIFMGVLAWVLGGISMLSGAYVFAILATKYEKCGGFMDYSEEIVGKKYAYGAGWFLATIYHPCATAIMAVVAADFTSQFLGLDKSVYGWDSRFVFTLAGFYIVVLFCINVLAPKLAGKLNTTATYIKLIPIIFIGFGGMVWAIFHQTPTITDMIQSRTEGSGSSFFGALIATGFAYGGWYTVTALNAEIKNGKRNLPIALIAGSIIVIAAYVLYFLGLSFLGDRANPPDPSVSGSESNWAADAFSRLINSGFSTIMILFIIISCIGALNSNIMGQNRSLYAISCRGLGPNSKVFSQLDPSTNSPHNASILVLGITMFWLCIQMFSELWGFGIYNWDKSGIIFDIGDITILGFAVTVSPIFVFFMFKMKDLHWINRFFMPLLALITTVFSIVSFFINGSLNNTPGWIMTLIYLAVIFVTILIGFIWFKKPKENAVA